MSKELGIPLTLTANHVDQMEDAPTRVLHFRDANKPDEAISLSENDLVPVGEIARVPRPVPTESDVEAQKTTFFDRGDLKQELRQLIKVTRDQARKSEGLPPARTTGDPPPPPSHPKPRPAVEALREQRKRSRRKRAVMVAAVCGVAGITLGTIVGLSLTDDTTAVAELAQEGSAAGAIVASEPAAEPAPPPVAEASTDLPSTNTQAEAQADAEGETSPPPSPLTVDELLAEARQGFRNADAERVRRALEGARATGADLVVTDRLAAQLAVLRGEGAAAVPRLRELAQTHEDAEIWVSLGRVLLQAENDRQAAQAFEVATVLDPSNPHAHIGLSTIRAHEAELGAAHRHLERARAASSETSPPDPQIEARIRTAQGIILLERGHIGRAAAEAEQARLFDRRSAEAALLLARIARLRGHDPVDHLRHAIDGRAPDPAALGLLARRARRPEACDLASIYLERAPEGFDSRAVRRVQRDCNLR